MAQKQKKVESENTPKTSTSEEVKGSASKGTADIDSVLNTVNITYGAHDVNLEMAGLTVNQLKAVVKDIVSLDISGKVECYIDGKLIPENEYDSTIVQSGTHVEWMKEAGQKGSRYAVTTYNYF